MSLWCSVCLWNCITNPGARAKHIIALCTQAYQLCMAKELQDWCLGSVFNLGGGQGSTLPNRDTSELKKGCQIKALGTRHRRLVASSGPESPWVGLGRPGSAWVGYVSTVPDIITRTPLQKWGHFGCKNIFLRMHLGPTFCMFAP